MDYISFSEPLIDPLQEIDDGGNRKAKKHKLKQSSSVNNKKKLKAFTKTVHDGDDSVSVNAPTNDTIPLTNVSNDRTAKNRKNKNKSFSESAHDSTSSIASLPSLKVKDVACNPSAKKDDLFSVNVSRKDAGSISVSKMSKRMKKKLKRNNKERSAKPICDGDNATETGTKIDDAVRSSRVELVENADTKKADKPIEKSNTKKHINSTADLEETEIWVPNKKYKGKLKGLYEKAIDGISDISPKKGDADKSFAKFDKLARTPPAFVRKAVQKVTPKTEPKKTGNKVCIVVILGQ